MSVIVLLVVVIIVITVIASNANKKNTVGALSTTTVPNVTSPPTTAAPVASTTPPTTAAPANCTNMSVGKSDGCGFTDVDTLAGGFGSTASFNLYVTQVIPHAAPDNSFDAAPAGQYILAVVEEFKGVKGTYQDDVNNETAVIGSNGQTYQPTYSGLAAYTNFNSGTVTVTPGQVSVGGVAFDIPSGVTVTQVTYSPADSNTASWKV